MRMLPPKKDLVILVADKNMEFTMKGLMLRYQSLGIRQLTIDCFVHPEHDPGCFLRAQDFLRPFINNYNHALVMFDLEGCGHEQLTRETLERQLEGRLAQSGWGSRAAAVVINPELEIWVWNNSTNVDMVMGWTGREPDLRSWLIEEGFIATRRAKPDRPKKAVEQALKMAGKARSSSLYFKIAQLVGLDGCVDPAFLKLRTILRGWFEDGK